MVTESKVYRISRERAVSEALATLKDCRFNIKEQTDDSIMATSGVSLFSWGEKIEIVFNKRADGVDVRVTSMPTAQLFDWGKSRDNISEFFTKLEYKLSRK
jgi:hypothetical protein